MISMVLVCHSSDAVVYSSDAVVYGSNGVRDDGVGGSCEDVGDDTVVHDFSDADDACESDGDNHHIAHHTFLFSA